MNRKHENILESTPTWRVWPLAVSKLHVYQTDNVDALYQRHLGITTPGSKCHFRGPLPTVEPVATKGPMWGYLSQTRSWSR